MRDKPQSARSHANGDSQDPRPVLSRFAAARTAVACREFVGEATVRRLTPPVVEISRSQAKFWEISTFMNLGIFRNFAENETDLLSRQFFG